jgi:hypothetical protein
MSGNRIRLPTVIERVRGVYHRICLTGTEIFRLISIRFD